MQSGSQIPTASFNSTVLMTSVVQSTANLPVVLFAVCVFCSRYHTATANNLQRAARNKALNGVLNFGRVVRGVRL